jgi:hypothetical protein
MSVEFIQQTFSPRGVRFPCSLTGEIKMRISIAIVIMMTFVSNDLFAAHFRDGGFLAHQGILESISIKPRLPASGESFTVNLSGSWPPVNPDGLCRAPLDLSEVEVYPGNRIQIISIPRQDPNYCDQPPASWNFDVTIPADDWDAASGEGFVLIEHLLYSGINTMTGIQQVFDMRLGTHEVPAFIGSGFWISPDLSNEGILVEQQDSRMLFYGLGYDRDPSLNDEGEPVWQLVAGEMYGNSTLGRSYRFDWPFDENNRPLENPTEMKLITENDSGAIIVDDYNHIQVFTEVSGVRGLYNNYNRIFFGLDKSRLPVYVPPLDGRWNLYGFDGQNAAFTATLELVQGSSQGSNQYHFASSSGDWLAMCTVVAPGTGDCSIERSSDNTKFEFPMNAFQGNLARGSLGTGENNTLDGVLVRDPWKLPVLDIQ